MPGLNASQHLLSLGWAGPGHPLNPSAYKQKGQRGLAYDPSTPSTTTHFSTASNGLIKPLLVSKKSNNYGLGRRPAAHEPQKGNEWWLKGFEAALGSVGTSREGSVATTPGTSTPVAVASATTQDLQRNVNLQMGKHGGLYGFFVRGGVEGGTNFEHEGSKGRKRKSDVLDDDDDKSTDSEEHKEEEEEQQGRSKAKKSQKKNNKRKKLGGEEDPQAEFAHVAAFLSVRDKDAKKRQERRKLRESEQFRVAGAWLELKDSDSKSLSAIVGRKGRKGERGELDEEGRHEAAESSPVPKSKSKSKSKRTRRLIVCSDGEEREETSEERRLRRSARRARRAGAGALETSTQSLSSADEKTAKHRRKEERRLRRERSAHS
jgi:hypothetical protein